MRIFLTGCCLCFYFLCSAQGTFQKLYDAWSIDGDARYLSQCSDSGFIISVGSNITGINIIKTDSDGNVEWVYAHHYACEGFNVIETYDHCFIVAGYRDDSFRIAPFMLKLSPNGNLLWSRGYYLTFSQGAWGRTTILLQTNDSGFVLASSLPLSWNMGFTNDIVVIKTDSAGNIIWSNRYGGIDNEWCLSIIKANPSGYLIMGFTDSNGPASRMIFKISDNGTLEWTRLLDPVTNSYPIGQPIQQTHDSGFVFLNPWSNDSSICKVDSVGNNVWSKSFTSNYKIHLSSLLQTRDGGIGVSGWLQDPPFSSYPFIAKLDSLGNTIWTKYYNDSLTCSSGAYTLLETFESGFAFSGNHQCQGMSEILLVKTDSLGNLSCPTYSIPGFQSASFNSPNNVFNLMMQTGVGFTDSTVSSNYNTFSYTESSFCFSPINTSIPEPTFSRLTISPNPFHSSTSLSWNGESQSEGKSFELKIFNSMGALVRTEKILNLKSYLLHRDGLRDGLYFYQLTPELQAPSSELSGSGKFIIN